MAEASLQSRVRAAHTLAILLWLQAVAALGGVPVSLFDGRPGYAILFGLVALFALAAGVLEWRRSVRGELLAFLSFIAGVFVSILALPAGMWFYVPWIGVTTLGVMLALMYRMAVRSESRHHVQAKHA